MNKKIKIEYPAFIYKKNNAFVANCILLNLVAFGKTEQEAVNSLQNTMQEVLTEFNIQIKPIYEEYKKQISFVKK